MRGLRIYRMGSCGISYELKLGGHGTARPLVVSGWDLSSEEQAKENLLKHLHRLQAETTKAIEELST